MNRDKLVEWKARLKEIEESGESVKGYCRKHLLSKDEGYYWLKKIREMEEEQVLLGRRPLTEIVFTEEKSNFSGIRISFGNGIELIPEKEFSEHEFLRIANLIKSL